MPSLIKHYKYDEDLQKKRAKIDTILSLFACIFVIIYGIYSIRDLLSRTTYEGICQDENVTAKVLCEDWSFRQCSFYGNQIGAKPNTNNIPNNNVNNNNNDGNNNNVNNNNVRTQDECMAFLRGDCPVYDFTSPNFCTQYKGGNMINDGILYEYVWQSDNSIEFKQIAAKGRFMCCGQIEQKVYQKIIIWLGVIGGFGGMIVRLITGLPVGCCIKKDNYKKEEIPTEGKV